MEVFMLNFTNTLSSKTQEFVPLKPKTVNMYVCGITPNDYAHIGHGRCYITFDILFRLLKFLDYTVTYCRNFTDIDDKLLKRAADELGDKFLYTEVAQQYIDAYHDDMKQLNCLSPDMEPRVTQMIPEIVEFIEKLIKSGHAYEANGSVYYSVRSFPDYGKLSKRNIDDLKAGARVDVNDDKKDPLDFALWKKEDEGTFWQSPWGSGRPGWHIECSVMSTTLLGPHLDIHGGGMDLIFPHHENEVAQSEGVHGEPFSRYWIHNAFVQINKEKMSKSLGNFFTLRDVFEKIDPMAVRYYILSHNYNVPLDFSLPDMEASQTAYKRLCIVFEPAQATDSLSDEDIKKSPIVEKMVAKLEDDLNTAGLLGVLFENLKAIQADPEELLRVKAFLQRVLGITLVPLAEKEVKITAEIQQLLNDRKQAREDKDWARSDAIRDRLNELGVDIQDQKV
jgi:cysteinyl-tRNA synthetase